MQVTIAKRKSDSLKELLARERDAGFGEPFMGVVAETYTEPKALRTFGFTEKDQARAQALAEMVGDETPEFVVVRTEEGWSRSGRLYDGHILDSIAEQVNHKQPVAHLGHIPDHEIATSFPDPQTTWFAAHTRMETSTLPSRAGQTVKVIYTAGYNLPGAKVRAFLKAGAVNSTSWQGVAEQTPIPGKGVKIVEFSLLSIDWARKGSEGMETARVVALAKEMQEGGKTKVEGDNKDLAQVSPEEFREANPNGYKLLVSEISAEKDKEIATLTQAVEVGEGDKTLLDEIRKVLKLAVDANPLEQIARLMAKLGEKAKASVSEELDKLLAEKVPDEEQRKLVRRLVPLAEMEAKAEDASDAEAVKKLVTEMTETAFNDDDMIQQVVSEQTPPIIRRREDLSRQSGNATEETFTKLGMPSERVKMGA